MRFCFGFVLLAFAGAAAVGCHAGGDDAATDDSSELNEGRGALERALTPPIDPPASPRIGAKIADVLAKATDKLQAGAPRTLGDGCTVTEIKDASASKRVVVEHLACTDSETVRMYAADGTIKEEDVDFDKDGLVDRFTGVDGAVSQYADTNFDGKIDLVVERVDKLTDFSLKGYGEDLPKSDFLYRIRDDRDHDGKLDHEKMTAKGALPPLAAAETQEE